MADITLLNIDYIAGKQTKNIRSFLQILNETFHVVGADNSVYDKAFQIDNNDLEDIVQYVCANVAECSVIVSNDKKFYRGEIEVLNSQEFVKKYLR
jgi:predicted nucleic acid-binding protein